MYVDTPTSRSSQSRPGVQHHQSTSESALQYQI